MKEPYRLLNEDCLAVMGRMKNDRMDAVVTDPPYGLSFMGHGWDRGVPGVPHWAEALRVLKPGGYALVCGGTRTYHRLACALEDSGFLIRDCLVWMYGKGWPKSRACLKPSWEPVLLARKPGPVVELGIDSCVGVGDRWPSNLVHDGTENVRHIIGRQNTPFFYCAKPDRVEKDAGLSHLPAVVLGSIAGKDDDLSEGHKSTVARRNTHPTVKPLSLMCWLVRLICPEGGTVLDPFMGSGSTGVACVQEGRKFVGCEMDKTEGYFPIAEGRLAAAKKKGGFL